MSYQKDSVRDIVEELKKYNLIDIIEKLSSLLLIFENIDKNLYFNYLLNDILCLSDDIYLSKENPEISYEEFIKIIKQVEETSLSLLIDPMEHIYYEKVMFHRDYYSFNGMNLFPSYTLNNIIAALFFTKNNINVHYKKQVSNLIQIVLRFQTEIINNNFLIANEKYFFTKNIFFPKSLLKMTTFDDILIKKSLGENYKLLEDFIIDVSKYNNDNVNNHNSFPFYKKPILKDGTDLIVLDATMLTSALIDKIIMLAKEYKCFSEVESYITMTIYSKNKLMLDKMFYNENHLKIPTLQLNNTSHHYENIYYISNEEVVVCFSEFAALNSYTNHSLFTTYDGESSFIKKRLNYFDDFLKKKGFKPLYVVVLNCINRGIRYDFNINHEIDILLFNSYELKMIYINEQDKPNFLLSYNKLKNICRPFIDYNGDMKYIAYFSCNNYSFYLNDEVDYREIDIFIGYEYIYEYISKKYNIEHKLMFTDILDHKNYVFKELENNVYSSLYMSDRIARFYIVNSTVDFYIRCDLNNAKNMDLKFHILSIFYYWLSNIDEIKMLCKNDFCYIIVDFKGEVKTNIDTCDDCIDVKKDEEGLIYISVYEEFFNTKFEILNNEYEKKLISKIINKIFVCDTYDIDGLFIPNHRMKLTVKNIENDLYLIPKEKGFIYPSVLEYELITETIGDLCVSMINDGITIKEQSEFLNILIDKLFDSFSKEIEKYDIEYLLKLAYNEYENVFSQMMLTNREFKKRIACYPEKQEEISANYINMNAATNSLRFIIEFIALSQQGGNKKTTLSELSALIALAHKITSYAEFSSYAKFNLIDINARVLKSGRLGINIGEIEQFQNDFVEHVNYSLEKGKAYKKSFATDIDFNLEINNIYIEEYGYSFTQLLEILDFINQNYRNMSDVMCVREEEFVEILKSSLEMDKNVIINIINDLSISKTDNLSKDINKILPWKYNKMISLYRKPFIKISGNIIWGTRTLSFIPHYIYNLILTGRFKTEFNKGAASRFNGKILDVIGKDYTDFVYKQLNLIEFLVCEKEKTVFNSKKMKDNDGDIGDIDVLCIHSEKHTIYFLECKCFRLAKNADEMRNFIDRMYGDDGHIKKVIKRKKWLEDHYDDVISEYHLNNNIKWIFKFAFIIDEPFILNYKTEYDITILTSDDLSINALESIK